MATTTKKFIIGFLTLVILATSVYIFLPNQLRIDVTNTKTTFKVWENISGTEQWILAGTEYTKLYNGSKLMTADNKSINYSILGNQTEIYRTAYYKEIKLIDTWKFDGSTKDKEQIPTNHEIRVLNGQGKTLQYEVNDLLYTGQTKIGIVSPQSFGHNMKVTWENENFYSQLFKYSNKDVGKLTIKYKIDSNDYQKNVRLFDPNSSLLISFIDPTPSNGSTISVNSTIITANVTDYSGTANANVSSFIDFDRSLIGYWSMDYYNYSGILDNSTYNKYAPFKKGLNFSNAYPGIRGNALLFDGSNDYAKTNISENLTAGTFCTWVYFKNITKLKEFWDIGTAFNSYIYMSILTSTLSFRIYDDTSQMSSTTCVLSRGSMVVNQWYHICGTWDLSGSGNCSLYVNTVVETDSSVNVSQINVSKFNFMTLGAKSDGGGVINGSFDESMLFNRSLVQSEINAIYNSQVNLFNTSFSNLSAGWHNYTLYAINQTGYVNQSYQNFFVNSCPYAGYGNWNVLFSDYCNVTNSVNAGSGTNNMSITGIGLFSTSANITGFKNYLFAGTSGSLSNITCSGGCFK